MFQRESGSELTCGKAVLFLGDDIVFDDAYAGLFGFSSTQELTRFSETPLELISDGFHAKIMSVLHSQEFSGGGVSSEGQIFYSANRFGRTMALFVLTQKTTVSDSPALEVLIFDISNKVSPHQLINRPKYERLVKNSRQGVVIHRYFKPLLFNQSWADFMGVESAEEFLANGSVLDVIPESHHLEALQRCEKVMRGESLGESHVIENHRLDGGKRYFNIYDHAISWEGEPALEVVIADVTDEVTAQNELTYRADHDSLTGLMNRSALYNWISECEHRVRAMACILIDIDNFKSVNDTCGHQEGDRVLRHISDLIRDQVGKYGVVGRWGGEEFIIFLPDTTESASYEMAEKVRFACENATYNQGCCSVQSTISIGVSYTGDFSSTEPKDLIRSADQNMYMSKTSGKNRVT